MQIDEAKVILCGLATDEEIRAASLLLKVLTLGRQEVVVGKVEVKPVAGVVVRLRAKGAVS